MPPPSGRDTIIKSLKIYSITKCHRGIRVKHKIISEETRRLYSRDVIDPRVVSQYRVQLTAGGSDVIQLNTSLVFLATDVDKLLR